MCFFLLVACDNAGNDVGNDILDPYFTGKVIEKYETSCLLEVIDIGNHNFAIGDKVIANTNVKNCPEYKVGDQLKISFNGIVSETYPVQINKVYIVSKVEDEQKSNNNLSQPITNLEFWIAENVDNIDYYSKYQAKYGIQGGYEFYGTGYIPTTDENGNQIDPVHCVIYTVTSFPDYSNREQHITHIYITDPNIEFYGISLNSTFEDFDYYIEKQGFEITHSKENSHTAEKDSFWITFSKEYISIGYRVTNDNGLLLD